MNMRMTVIPVVVGALRKFLRSLEWQLTQMEIRVGIETIEVKAFLKWARIQRNARETRRDLLLSRFQWKITSKRWCKKFSRSKIIIIIIIIIKSITHDTTRWGRWSTGKCAKNWNLTLRTSGICTTRNPSWGMRCTKFSGILRYKQIS